MPIDDTSYIRRYLDDSSTLDTPSTPYTEAPPVNTIDLSYLRRYLGDQ